MMIVWRIRGKIIRTVLCCVVYNSCTQWHTHTHTHTHKQFLKTSVGLHLDLVFVHLFWFSICFFLFSLDFLFLCCLFCWVRFSFFSTMPRDWLGGTSPKWPILCRAGRKILTSQSAWRLYILLIPRTFLWPMHTVRGSIWCNSAAFLF